MANNGYEKSWIRQKLETPCYRSSLLYGISSGIGAGLAFFLFTSRQRAATHVGVASYATVTLGAWCYCRYRWTQKQMEERLFRRALEQKILTEGTPNDFQLQLPEQSTLPQGVKLHKVAQDF